jgi:hypothetical protein
MRLLTGFSLSGFAAPAIAHDGPLLSMAHADFWGVCFIALAVLFASASVAISSRTKTLPEAPVGKEALSLDLAPALAGASKSIGSSVNA